MLSKSPEPDYVFGSAFAVDGFDGAAQLLSRLLSIRSN